MRYLILGMHKSGTTALAQTLHAGGIDMGRFDAAVGYDEGNHHERAETQRLNKQLLGCGDANSLDVFRPVAPADADPTLVQEMAETIRKLDAQHESWGFKDPRTCLTWAVWARLGAFRVVGVYRHPLEVWNRYIHARSPLKRLLRVGRGFRALRAWHVYNCQLLACNDDPNTEVFLLEYGDFMRAGAPLSHLARFVARELPDMREPALYRAQQAPARLYQFVRFLQARLFGRDVEALYRALERRRSAQAQAGSNETGSAVSQR